MSSASTRKIEGFHSIGGEAPFLDPHKVVIVGLDIPDSDTYWYAKCARLKDVTDKSLEPYVQDILRRKDVPNIVDGVKDGHRVLVLDGRRTTRAARIACERSGTVIPVRVRLHQGRDRDLYEINVRSHDGLELTELQYAQQVLTFFNMTGEDLAETAAFFKTTTTTVRNYLKVFSLSEQLQRAIAEDGLALSNAIKLADEPREKQEEIFGKLRDAQALRGIRASNGIEAAKRGEAAIGRDTTRMLSRKVLFSLREMLIRKKRDERPTVDALEFLKIILGSPVPKDFDAEFVGLLTEAGFKPKKTTK